LGFWLLGFGLLRRGRGTCTTTLHSRASSSILPSPLSPLPSPLSSPLPLPFTLPLLTLLTLLTSALDWPDCVTMPPGAFPAQAIFFFTSAPQSPVCSQPTTGRAWRPPCHLLCHRTSCDSGVKENRSLVVIIKYIITPQETEAVDSLARGQLTAHDRRLLTASSSGPRVHRPSVLRR
jgi:hypothetical protein